ncbi:hypothetical protein SEA_FIREMAN_55 [Microbacterium phage Fireman]|uniref:Uncharacterized protein n=1 Tax=Microbacterium phage Fireman TaxID=2530118 RepID=A0A481VWL8_9CAUD|nr:hypothetical protein HOV22_gp55 [Microbacterium phage Fireman]QBI98138.1 hypothetical protein SEA_FIREMAN_55 [Microbacterium phage Fireman]
MTGWWHRTCEHRAPKIEADGFLLRPQAHPILGNLPLVWLSSTPNATRAMLGLTSNTLECDRMAHLFKVVEEDESKIAWWGDVMRAPDMTPFLPGARRLMAVRGTRPGLWGVSADPIRVERVV